MQPPPWPDELRRGDRSGHEQPLLPRPLEMMPFLHRRGPAAIRPHDSHHAAPAGQVIVPLQVDGQTSFLCVQDPPAGGPALLAIKVVGDRDSHDAVGPVGARKHGPFRALKKAPGAARQTLPERFPRHDALLPARGEIAQRIGREHRGAAEGRPCTRSNAPRSRLARALSRRIPR